MTSKNRKPIEHYVAASEEAFAAWRASPSDAGRKDVVRLYRKVLALRREALQETHPDIAASLDNLAVILQWIGGRKYDHEAIALFRETVALRKTLLPAGHIDIALSLDNLAASLEDNCQLAEAAAVYREALAAWRSALPSKHPDVVISAFTLATVLHSLGDSLDEAEALYREVLEVCGSQTPMADTLPIAVILWRLGTLLLKLGRLDEAEPILMREMEIGEKLADGKFEDAAGCADSLAAVARLMEQRGRLADAVRLASRHLEVLEGNLGSHCDDTVNAMRDLARMLRDAGRIEESECLLERAQSEGANETEEMDLSSDFFINGKFAKNRWNPVKQNCLWDRNTSFGTEMIAMSTFFRERLATWR